MEAKPQKASDSSIIGVPELPSPSFVPRPKRGLVDSEEVVGQQLFLYDESTEAVHTFNSGAGLVWLMCDGERDVESISTSLLHQARPIVIDSTVVVIEVPTVLFIASLS